MDLGRENALETAFRVCKDRAADSGWADYGDIIERMQDGVMALQGTTCK